MVPVELEKRVEMIVEAGGFRLVSANWTPIKGRQQLRIVADAEDHNITIGECSEISRAVSDLLDSYPHEFPDYRLEVSSPGLKHPLEKWQFRKNLERIVEVRFMENNVQQRFAGKLSDVSEEDFTIQGEAESQRFTYTDAGDVFVQPSFSKSK